ncbi:MAG TPA: YvcK family protein [Bacillales bacterium]|nr:YvcK family protein [Bacillales bacterium]
MKDKNKPKLVVIGGGTGLSVLLRGLKRFPVDLTAIVTVADDGGSSGILRSELEIPPPGDIRNVLAALSDAEPLIKKLFQYRFQNGNGLSGHSLGNLLLAGITSITGDFVSGIRELSRVLNVNGIVLPAANHSIVLNAVMKDGTVVEGESKIPKMNKKIDRVYLTPDNIEPLPETLEAIKHADLIVIGPGSLYTSILPNLLVPRLGEAVCRAQAKKVYICNVMTQQGETNGFTASDHVQALVDHLQCQFIDTIVVNNKNIPDDIAERYQEEGASPVRYDEERLKSFGFQVISGKMIQYDHSVVRHNERKIAKLLYAMVTPG